MRSGTTQIRVGAEPAFLLFLVFLVLKLTKVIDWSWWAVASPLWVPALVVAAFLLLGGAVVILKTLGTGGGRW